ncbi:MAG: hypothetical protein WCL16_08605 [bacterium]
MRRYAQFDRALISRLASNFAALPAMDVKSPLALPAPPTETGEPPDATVAASAVRAQPYRLVPQLLRLGHGGGLGTMGVPVDR